MKYISLLVLLLTWSCELPVNLKEESKKEILQTEKAFAQMAREAGISNAFIAFADRSAVLERNNVLISGFDSIKAYFSTPIPAGTKLEWTPDFVDASASGDLGYTYGKFVYSRLDSAGNPEEITGVFHTIWKKQDDGSWKYVWD